MPEAAGEYDHACCYITTAGRDWLYADLDGTGNDYNAAQLGVLIVLPAGDTTAPEAPANLRQVAAAPSFITLARDVVRLSASRIRSPKKEFGHKTLPPEREIRQGVFVT